MRSIYETWSGKTDKIDEAYRDWLLHRSEYDEGPQLPDGFTAITDRRFDDSDAQHEAFKLKK